MFRLFSIAFALLFTLCSANNVTLKDYAQASIVCHGNLPSTCLGSNYSNSSLQVQQSYNFSNSEEAFKLLTELDFAPQIILVPPEKPKKYKPFIGVKNQSDYCQRHRAYFVENPDFIFKDFNFFIEEAPSFLRIKAFRPIGNDMHPEASSGLPKDLQSSPLFDLRPDVSLYFTKNDMHSYLEVDTQFSCLTQQYNHIPGHSYLVRKDLVARSAMRYAENFIERPHCFNYTKIFPETWLLHSTVQCQDFSQS